MTARYYVDVSVYFCNRDDDGVQYIMEYTNFANKIEGMVHMHSSLPHKWWTFNKSSTQIVSPITKA